MLSIWTRFVICFCNICLIIKVLSMVLFSGMNPICILYTAFATFLCHILNILHSLFSMLQKLMLFLNDCSSPSPFSLLMYQVASYPPFKYFFLEVNCKPALPTSHHSRYYTVLDIQLTAFPPFVRFSNSVLLLLQSLSSKVFNFF